MSYRMQYALRFSLSYRRAAVPPGARQAASASSSGALCAVNPSAIKTAPAVCAPARSKGVSIHRRPNRMSRTARFFPDSLPSGEEKNGSNSDSSSCSAPMAGQPNRITSPSGMPSSADVTSVSDTSVPQLRAPSAIALAIFSVFPAPDQYTMCIIL